MIIIRWRSIWSSQQKIFYETEWNLVLRYIHTKKNQENQHIYPTSYTIPHVDSWIETKRPETVGPRNKENNLRAWRDAQQQANQAIILTNLSARSRRYIDWNNLQDRKNQGIQLFYEKWRSTTATSSKIGRDEDC